MGRRAAALVLATLFLALAPPGPSAHADDTSVGGIGGTVYPTTSADIVLEAETVQAVLFGGFAEYRVDFAFVNEGPAQTVMLGFPFAITAGDPVYGSYPPTAFRAWQDGRALDITVTRDVRQSDMGDGTAGFFLHEAEFPQGRTIITVSYLTRPSWSSAGSFGEVRPPDLGEAYGWDGWYDYWLHTGASWSGPIDRAVVRIAPADSFLAYGMDAKQADFQYAAGHATRPETYRMAPSGEFRWVFEDFEPDDADEAGLSRYDVRFGFENLRMQTNPTTPLPLPGAPFRIVDVSASSISDLTTSGEYAPRGAADGIPNTYWAEGGSGAGIGESLHFELADEADVREVRILPGKNRETGIFGLCGRPSRVRVTFSDGSTYVFDLTDEPTMQRFPVEARARWADLEILASTPGTQQDDTYISEVEFGGAAAPEFIGFNRLLAQGLDFPQSALTTTSTTSGVAPAIPIGGAAATTGTSAPPEGESTPAIEQSPSADGDRGRDWVAPAAVAAAGIACLVVLAVALWWPPKRLA